MLFQLYISLLLPLVYSSAVLHEVGHSSVFPDSTTLTLYIEFINTGKQAITLKIIHDQCCIEVEQDDIDCDVFELEKIKFVKLLSHGEEDYTRRIQYIIHNMYLRNLIGYCTFNIISSDHQYREQIILHINTTTLLNNNNNNNNNIIIDECTSVDQDRESKCRPVNCVLKYNGSRNYFNPTTLKCEAVPECNTLSEDQMDIVAYYDSETNTCIKLPGGLVEDTTTETEEGLDEEILTTYT